MYHYQNQDEQHVDYNAFKQPVEIYEKGKERISYEFNAAQQRSDAYYGDDNSDKLLRPFRRHYSQDGSMEITEDIPNGKTSFVFYIGGNAYSAPLIWKYEQTSSGSNSGLYYFQRDHLGSIRLITDENANVVEKRQFDAWGQLVKLEDGAGNPLTNFTVIDRGFTGHEQLLGVGLIHMNGRLYDPLLHRFLQPDGEVQDPTFSQNFNRYGYVFNNPLRFADPSGEMALAAFVGAVNQGLNSRYGGHWSESSGHSDFVSQSDAFMTIDGILDASGGWGGTAAGSFDAAWANFSSNKAATGNLQGSAAAHYGLRVVAVQFGNEASENAALRDVYLQVARIEGFSITEQRGPGVQAYEMDMLWERLIFTKSIYLPNRFIKINFNMNKFFTLLIILVSAISTFADEKEVVVSVFQETPDFRAGKPSNPDVIAVVKSEDPQFLQVAKFLDPATRESLKGGLRAWGFRYGDHMYYNTLYAKGIARNGIFIRLDITGNYCAAFIGKASPKTLKSSSTYYGLGLSGALMKASENWGVNTFRDADNEKVRILIVNTAKFDPLTTKYKPSYGNFLAKNDLKKMLPDWAGDTDLSETTLDQAIAYINEANKRSPLP